MRAILIGLIWHQWWHNFKKSTSITVHPEETMNLYAMSSQSTQLRLNSTLYQRGQPAGDTRIKFILWGLWTILPIVVWAKKCRRYWTQRGHRIRLRGILGGETTGLTNSLRFILWGPGTICTRYHRDSQSLGLKPFYSAFNEAVLNHTKLYSSVFPSGSISSRTPAWFRRRRHKSDADGSDGCRYSVQMFRLL